MLPFPLEHSVIPGVRLASAIHKTPTRRQSVVIAQLDIGGGSCIWFVLCVVGTAALALLTILRLLVRIGGRLFYISCTALCIAAIGIGENIFCS